MDNSNVMVSVLCTAYNHERYIRKSLDGFVSQKTNFRYEVIVHDDASTDATAEIIREYAEKYPEIIRPIYQTKNQFSQKVQIIRTILMPVAQGKYIAFCEGDDYWTDDNKLQKQVDFLEKNQEYSATTHNCCFVGDHDEPISNIYPIYRNCKSHRYTLKRFSRDVVYPGQTATLLFRKSEYYFDSPELEKAFYSMRVLTGDKRTYLKLLLSGDIYCFEDVMSAYRIVTQNGDSWSARNYGKNGSYLLHIASIDFRKFVRHYYGKPFYNHYSTFHTGVAGIVKYILKPNAQNKQVCQQIIEEHNGVVRTLLYFMGLGIISVPLFFLREYEKQKYDL